MVNGMPTPEMEFVITEAKDWPMLVCMFAVIGILVSGLIGLTCWMWKDLKTSFRNRCIERRDSCKEEFGYLWKAIDECCPRKGDKGS